MKPMPNRLRAVALSLPILLAISAGCDIAMADYREQETAEWRKTYQLEPGGRVEIANVNGKVQIMPGEGSAVEVYAKKVGKGASKAAAKQAIERVEIVDGSAGGVIRLETKVNRGGSGLFDHASAQVEYVVRVPVGAELKLSTVNGGLDIQGMGGKISAEATNGGIRAREITGVIDASTTNGGVDVDLAAIPAEGIKLECTNGGIRLRLPTDGKATVSARISNGGIDVSGVNIQNRGEPSSRRLDGDLNGGGPRLSLEGTNGGISIRAR